MYEKLKHETKTKQKKLLREILFGHAFVKSKFTIQHNNRTHRIEL